MRNLIREFCADESGAVIAYVLISMVIMTSILAMSINTVIMHLVVNRLQITADMAALAGASQLPDQDAATAMVNSYAELNMSAANWQDVVGDADIIFGNWKRSVTPKFSTSRTPINAVRVIARRSSTNPANSNPQPTILRVSGTPAVVDISVQAIAWSTVSFGSNCYTNGFIAKGTVGKIESGSENKYDSFCLHGEDGVKVGSQNYFADGSQVSMNDLNDLDAGSDNYGLEDALKEAENPPTAAEQITSLLNDFKNLNGPFPDYLDTSNPITVNNDYEGPYLSGKYYIVNGIVTIKEDISNVGIYSTKVIKVDSNLTLQNAFMVSEDKIDLGSNIQIGAIPYGSESTPPDPSACDLITGTVFMTAQNEIKLGSELTMSGLQAISGGNFEIGSENKIHGDVGVQAAGVIKYGSQEQYQGCNSDNAHILVLPPGAGTKLQLVN